MKGATAAAAASALLCLLAGSAGCSSDFQSIKGTTEEETVSPEALQNEKAQAATGARFSFRSSEYYTLTDPNQNGCAGDLKTYFDAWQLGSDFQPLPFDEDTFLPERTIKPAFVKNISVDLSDGNYSEKDQADEELNLAFSCSLGNSTNVATSTSCARFDTGFLRAQNSSSYVMGAASATSTAEATPKSAETGLAMDLTFEAHILTGSPDPADANDITNEGCPTVRTDYDPEIHSKCFFGSVGEQISIEYTTADDPPEVTVEDERKIIVGISPGVTTADEIRDTIEGDDAASALVDVTVASGQDSTPQELMDLPRYYLSRGGSNGYYSLFDQDCMGAGPITTGDPEVNKLLAGGAYIDIDRTELGPSENLLLHLTFFPFGEKQKLPDCTECVTTNTTYTNRQSAQFKVHLVATGEEEELLTADFQPRHLKFWDVQQFPKVVDTLTVLAPPTGQVTEQQVLLPISADPRIDRIRIERYAGSGILIAAAIFRMGYR